MQAQRTPERKYALTRLGPGDYVLPGNDGKTLWRIAKYTEGPSSGLLDWPRDREFWGYWKYMEPLRSDAPFDPDDWEKWHQIGGLYATRQNAIDDALDEPARGAER